jgi:hypothetical protein
MENPNSDRYRQAAWLILASVVVLIGSMLVFGSAAVRTPEFNRLQTVEAVAAYVAPHRTAWVALGLGLLVGAGLTFIGLMLISAALMATRARPWGIAGMACLAGSLALLIFSSYLLVGLAAGPDHLPPLVASQKVSPQRAVIGAEYENVSGLLATLGLSFVSLGLFASGLLRRTGLVIAVLALLLTILGLFIGATAGPIVILSVPIAIGLLLQKPQKMNS